MWQENILQGQKGSTPKYHQPSETSGSLIFVVEDPNLPQAKLQTIFSERHILIRHDSRQPTSFGLTELFDVASPIELYGEG
jgi:hypothetical protein